MSDSLKISMGTAFLASASELAAVRFQPEDIHLGDYAFVPFVRSGLSAAIGDPPQGNRATVRATLDVGDSADAGANAPVERRLTLYGPGDVTGIDPAQIVRREPAAGTANAEQGYLAHVEFARPEFPWLFSPFPAQGDRCEPWLALVVCDGALSALAPSQGELPAQLWTKKGQLQPLSDNYRLCHAQVVGAGMDGDKLRLRGDGADTVQTRLSDEHGPANLSRILCPRRLNDGKDYIAALVPAFDCGVRAGLGLGGGTLDPAWQRAAGDDLDDIVLPVYDAWTFRTAPGGSFQELARRIKGRPAPWSVGRRRIDLAHPGGGIPSLGDDAPEGVQLLECALVSPAAPPPDEPAPVPWPVENREALRRRVDQANEDSPDLPRVGARMYARYQRAASRIGQVFGDAPFGPAAAAPADADWFTQLNTDPLLRIVAGVGARVVQKDQEQLMQAAWAQVAGIRKANQALVWAGLAEVVNISVERRHLAALDTGALMQVTRNVHARIRDAGRPRTVAAAVIDSRTAETTLGAGFRRAVRPGGPVGRRMDAAAARTMVADGGGFRDHRLPVATPDGIAGLSDRGMRFFSPAVVARVMGVAEPEAMAALKSRVRVLADTGPAAVQFAAGLRDGTIATTPREALGGLILNRIGDRLSGVAPGNVAEIGGLAELAVGLVNAGGAVSERARGALDRIGQLVPAADPDGPVVRPVAPGVPVPPLTPGRPGTVGAGTLRGGPAPGLTRPDLTQPGPGVTARFGRVVPEIRDIPLTPRPPVPLKPEVRFETDLSRNVTRALQSLDRMTMAGLQAEMTRLVTATPLPPQVNTDLGPLTVTRAGLMAQIEPRATARAAFKGRLSVTIGIVAPDWIDRRGLRPIMAAPVFDRPMHDALSDYDRDWLVPGLGQIAERDFMTLLKVNPRFAEAFLIGASDEMGRELLWRDYPTDQRGTYFRRFWDRDQDELIQPVHLFDRTPVGRHFAPGGTAKAGSEPLALVVRGELLRRFPDTVVMALQATSSGSPPEFVAGPGAPVIFQGRLDPDYSLVGFDLTADQVRAGNWWFVLAQNPAGPRFGLAANPSASTEHDRLDWADFGDVPEDGFLPFGKTFPVSDENSRPRIVQWPGHAGTVARILLTNPVRAAFRAKSLIDKISPQP